MLKHSVGLCINLYRFSYGLYFFPVVCCLLFIWIIVFSDLLDLVHTSWSSTRYFASPFLLVDVITIDFNEFSFVIKIIVASAKWGRLFGGWRHRENMEDQTRINCSWSRYLKRKESIWYCLTRLKPKHFYWFLMINSQSEFFIQTLLFSLLKLKVFMSYIWLCGFSHFSLQILIQLA